MLRPRLQQLLDALLAIGQRPLAGKEVRVIVRHHLLVGGGDPATLGIALARGGLGIQPACPVVAGLPARGRQQPAQVVVLPAQGDPAGGHEPDVTLFPQGVGHHDVLHRRGVGFGCGHELFHRPGSVEPQPGDQGTRVRLQGSPTHCDGVTRPTLAAVQTGGDRQAGIADHRAVPAAPDLERHRSGPPHLDHLFAGLEAGPAPARGFVALGIVRMQPLQIQVLHVRAGVGESPGHLLVLAQHHQGQARQCGAGHLQAGRLQPREVPQRRCTEFEMRVVGQQRFAGLAACARHHPVVGTHPFHTGLRGGRHHLVDQVGADLPLPHPLGQVNRRQRFVSRVGRQQLPQPVVVQPIGQAQAQQFAGPVAAEVPGHHDHPGQAVDRIPALGSQPQQQELWRACAQVVAQVGIHPSGVGQQGLATLTLGLLPLPGRRLPHPQRPQEAVVVHRRRAEGLRQPPRTDATVRLHLPEPVLRMGKPQPEPGAFGRPGPNGRDAIPVPLDLHLRHALRQPLHPQPAAVHRQRQLAVPGGERQQHQHHCSQTPGCPDPHPPTSCHLTSRTRGPSARANRSKRNVRRSGRPPRQTGRPVDRGNARQRSQGRFARQLRPGCRHNVTQDRTVT